MTARDSGNDLHRWGHSPADDLGPRPVPFVLVPRPGQAYRLMAMILDDLKKRMMAAMKAEKAATSPEQARKLNVEKELWRTAIGEITMSANVAGVDASDEMVLGILKKMLKSNEETTKMAAGDSEQATQLGWERELLVAILPAGLSVEAVQEKLAPVAAAITAAKNDGQGVGVAMKHLRSAGIEADGKVVSEAVARLRRA